MPTTQAITPQSPTRSSTGLSAERRTHPDVPPPRFVGPLAEARGRGVGDRNSAAIWEKPGKSAAPGDPLGGAQPTKPAMHLSAAAQRVAVPTSAAAADAPAARPRVALVALNTRASTGNKTTTLDRNSEIALCRAWRDQQDTSARNELVAAHLDGVRAIAQKYVSTRAPLEDLVAAGRLGLLRACDSFDPERGLRFMTYASFWVRAEMLSFVWSNRSLVPSARSKLQRRLHPLRHERDRMLQQTGDQDQVDSDLAERAGVSVEIFRRQLSEWNRRDVALDAPVAAGGTTTRLEELADDSPDSELQLMSQQIDRARTKAVRGALQVLDERERFIVELHLMAPPEDEMSLSELGAALGVSRERVRQLELRAKRKIVSHLKRTPGQAELLLVS